MLSGTAIYVVFSQLFSTRYFFNISVLGKIAYIVRKPFSIYRLQGRHSYHRVFTAICKIFVLASDELVIRRQKCLIYFGNIFLEFWL